MNAIELYEKKYFAGHYLTCIHIDQIETRVTDLEVWEAVLLEWHLNGWYARSVGKMLDKYEQDVAKKQPYVDPRSSQRQIREREDMQMLSEIG